MEREFSAGGVLVRRLAGRWMVAAIRPAGQQEGVWALPKGRLDKGERPEEAALHEVAEVRWLPLDDAPGLLAYGGERDMVRKALARLSGDGV